MLAGKVLNQSQDRPSDFGGQQRIGCRKLDAASILLDRIDGVFKCFELILDIGSHKVVPYCWVLLDLFQALLTFRLAVGSPSQSRPDLVDAYATSLPFAW